MRSKAAYKSGFQKKNNVRIPDGSNPSECLKAPHSKESMYLRTLSKLLVGDPLGGRCNWQTPNCQLDKRLPYDENIRKTGDDWPPLGYTMVGHFRLENIWAAVDEVIRTEVPGAIVELGVWRGGSMMMAKAVTKHYKSTKDLYLFDIFGEIKLYGQNTEFLCVSEEDVKNNFNYYELYDQHVHFVKGLFKDSLPKFNSTEIIDKIAVLRIDGNYYDSYQDAMYFLYPKVPVGGIVIFDDFTFPAIQQFWKDFKGDHGLPEEVKNIDNYGGWFRKEKDVIINWKHFKPARDANK